MASVDYAWSIELGQELTASEAHEKWFMGILLRPSQLDLIQI